MCGTAAISLIGSAEKQGRHEQTGTELTQTIEFSLKNRARSWAGKEPRSTLTCIPAPQSSSLGSTQLKGYVERLTRKVTGLLFYNTLASWAPTGGSKIPVVYCQSLCLTTTIVTLNPVGRKNPISWNVRQISSPWSGNSLSRPLLISSSLLCLVDIFLSNTFKKNKHKVRIKSLLPTVMNNMQTTWPIHSVLMKTQTHTFVCFVCLMPTKTTHLVFSDHSKGTSRSWSKAQPWTWPRWSCSERNPDILLHTRHGGAQRALSIFPLIMMLSKMSTDRGICSEVGKCTPGDSHWKWVDLCVLCIYDSWILHMYINDLCIHHMKVGDRPRENGD